MPGWSWLIFSSLQTPAKKKFEINLTEAVLFRTENAIKTRFFSPPVFSPKAPPRPRPIQCNVDAGFDHIIIIYARRRW